VIKIENIEGAKNFSNSLELSQRGIRGVDAFKLSPRSHCDYSVAIYQSGHEGKVLIPHHGGAYQFEIVPGVYLLETHLTGLLRESPYSTINPKIEYWRLVYNQSANPKLELTKVLRNDAHQETTNNKDIS
jgi:hypothetical protein